METHRQHRSMTSDSPVPGENWPPGTRSATPFAPNLIAIGLFIVLLFMASFALWSRLAPLESAVVSSGILSAASARKTIQHLEGGIIESILVRDGDQVRQGDVLVQLSDVAAAARLRQLELQQFETLAVVARLEAELSGRHVIPFPEVLRAQEADPAVKSAMQAQKNILGISRRLIEDQSSVSRHQIAQAEEQIKGLQGQLLARRQQQKLLQEELENLEQALSKSLVAKSEVLQLRRSLADSEGKMSALTAGIDKLEQSILELRLNLSESEARRSMEWEAQLRAQRALAFELEEKVIAARDVLRRTRITAPLDGVVVNLQIHTRSGVISPGQKLMDIVPGNDELVVDAYIHPDDIDEVQSGMEVFVRLTSLTRRSWQPLSGRVANVSADRLTEADSGREYYLARIELDEVSAANQQAKLLPGMGAEVFIRTGARTPLEYLLQPISSSIARGLREH